MNPYTLIALIYVALGLEGVYYKLQKSNNAAILLCI